MDSTVCQATGLTWYWALALGAIGGFTSICVGGIVTMWFNLWEDKIKRARDTKAKEAEMQAADALSEECITRAKKELGDLPDNYYDEILLRIRIEMRASEENKVGKMNEAFDPKPFRPEPPMNTF